MLRPTVLITLAMLSCGALHAAEPKSLAVGKSPESVCRGFDGKLYVTLINGDEPGDGKILVVDGDSVATFTEGLNSPKGIAFVGNFLVASDETTLWKVDSSGKKTKLASGSDFPTPVEFLNDVAASHDGASVYVSEMSTPSPMFDPKGDRKLWDLDSDQAKSLPKKGCVYRVTLDGKITVAVPPGSMELRFPNGVTVEEGRPDDALFIGDFFTGRLLSYQDGKFQTVASGLRGIDGLTVLKETCYASSWTQGKVWQVDRATGKTEVLLEGLKSAADFYYDAPHQQLIIPDMLSGTLVFLPIKN